MKLEVEKGKEISDNEAKGHVDNRQKGMAKN